MLNIKVGAKSVAAILFCLILVEYSFFYQLVLNKIADHYPPGIDQANYLYASYKLNQHMIEQGILSGLLHYKFIPTTFLFVLQASFFFLLFGASRLTALSINFLYFAVLQFLGFYTIKKLTQRYSLAFLFLGLLLSTASFFNFGGAVDFRIDFIAMCLYGILICFILNSQIFSIRSWSIASAFLASFLMLMRFIVSVYIFGLIACLFLFFFFRYRKNTIENLIRIKNLFLFSVIIAAIVLPILWLHRDLLFSYYGVGHALGPEKWVRAEIAGVASGLMNLAYYPLSFIKFQLTPNLLVNLSLVFLFLGCVCWIFRVNKKNLALPRSFIDQITFLALSIGVPLVILTIDYSKSSIVSSIFLVPFLLVIIWSYWFLEQKIQGKLLFLNYGITSLFFFIGVGQFYFSSHEGSVYNQKNLITINKMIEDIGNYAKQAKLKNIYLTTNKYEDFFIAIPVYYYEVHHVLLNFYCSYGCGSQKRVKSQFDALEQIRQSNLFIAKTGDFFPEKLFLFEDSIKDFQGNLQKQASKEMRLMDEYRIGEKHYQVYFR